MTQFIIYNATDQRQCPLEAIPSFGSGSTGTTFDAARFGDKHTVISVLVSATD